MHVGVIEAILHGPPRIVEHLRPFRRLIYSDFRGEGHLLSRTTPGRRGRCASRTRTTAPGRTSAATDADRIPRAAFLIEQRTPVARQVQTADPSAESTAGATSTAATTSRVIRRRGTPADPRELFPIVLHRVNRRCVAPARRLRRGQNQRPRIVRCDVALHAVGHARDHQCAPLDAVPIDVGFLHRLSRSRARTTASAFRFRTLFHVVRIFILPLQRDHENLRAAACCRSAPTSSATATAAALIADEIQLLSVSRKTRLPFAARIERNFMFLPARRRNHVNV